MLLNIKYEFSNILKAKKKSLKEEINSELEARKKELDEKHKVLSQLFAEKYHHKVETELKKEVDRRFRDILSSIDFSFCRFSIFSLYFFL